MLGFRPAPLKPALALPNSLTLGSRLCLPLTPHPGATNLDIIQEVEYVKEEDKLGYLLDCLGKTAPPVLIFAENKKDVDIIHEYLLTQVGGWVRLIAARLSCVARTFFPAPPGFPLPPALNARPSRPATPPQ